MHTDDTHVPGAGVPHHDEPHRPEEAGALTDAWGLAGGAPAGTHVPVAADDAAGIAPGVVEVVEPGEMERYVSPVMTVAAVTGRAVGLAGRCLWWLPVGLYDISQVLWEWLQAADYRQAAGPELTTSDLDMIKSERKERRRTAAITGGIASALNTLGWAVLARATDISWVDTWYWPWAVEGGLLGVLAVARGHYRSTNPGMAPGQLLAADDAAQLDAAAAEDEDDGEPFPLAYCRSAEDVEECVRRAFAHQRLGLRSVRVRQAYDWGWALDVHLRSSTPAEVQKAAEKLDVHFDLAKGRTLIDPDPEQSSRLMLLLQQRDPFESMPTPVVHEPNSLSVKDLIVRGQGMDGSPFRIKLHGLSMILIGRSGAAKTKGGLRSLAEAITACRDAVMVEMDPVKDGMREFAPLLGLPPIRGRDDCTLRLQQLKNFASARSKEKNRLGMGDWWEPSPEHPNVYVVVDEFIFLPQAAKEAAIDILRIGREAGVYLIFAAQEATEDSLGDAIANSVTYRVMLASRSEDIRLVFGTGAASEGYRPDRLEPAADDERVMDAGKFYVRGGGHVRPMLWRWPRYASDQIRAAVAERAAAGRPWFDLGTLAGADLTEWLQLRPDSAGGCELPDLLDALDDARACQLAGLLRLYAKHDAQFLATSTIVAAGIVTDPNRLRDLLGELVEGAGAERRTVDGEQVRGWDVGVVEKAATALLKQPVA